MRVQARSESTQLPHAPPSPPPAPGPRIPGNLPLGWPFGTGSTPHSLSISGQPVVLAFHASPEGAAAARVAGAIARRLHATVQVVSVVDATPVPIPYPLDIAIPLDGEAANGPAHRDHALGLSDALQSAVGAPVTWPSAIELGKPVAVIARRAERARAALIVMGLRRHHLVDRVTHDETTLSVMRTAATPVLGVATGMTGLPTSSLVAMDFGPASVHAAAAAATLMAAGGTMTLAFVESMLEHDLESSDGVIHTLGITAAFAALVRVLERPDLRVDHVILHHSKPATPSAILLEHADERGFDLLAAGSARHGRLDRILLGSVSAELVRDGRYSVLIAPPAHG
jgi:nucleotide-binding universal stress UspA family protein